MAHVCSEGRTGVGHAQHRHFENAKPAAYSHPVQQGAAMYHGFGPSRLTACVVSSWVACASAAGFEPSPTFAAGTSVAEQPWLAGDIVEDVTTPFDFLGTMNWCCRGDDPVVDTGRVTGAVQSRVVHSIDGTYDFYWRIFVNSDSFLPIDVMSITGIPAVDQVASWRNDLEGGEPPRGAGLAGSVLTWDFFFNSTSAVPVGSSSVYMFIDTQATAYTRAASIGLGVFMEHAGNSLGGASGFIYPTFAPAVPEPSTVVLLVGGLAAFAWRRR
jgi:hypothetical protein